MLFHQACGNDMDRQILLIKRKISQVEGLRKLAPHLLPINYLAIRMDFHKLRERPPDILLAYNGQPRGPYLGQTTMYWARPLVT